MGDPVNKSDANGHENDLSTWFYDQFKKSLGELRDAEHWLATSGPNGGPNQNIKAWVGTEGIELKASAQAAGAVATSNTTLAAVGLAVAAGVGGEFGLAAGGSTDTRRGR